MSLNQLSTTVDAITHSSKISLLLDIEKVRGLLQAFQVGRTDALARGGD